MKFNFFVLVLMFIVFNNLSFSQGLYLYGKVGYSASNFTPSNYELNQSSNRSSFTGDFSAMLISSVRLALFVDVGFVPIGIKIKDADNDFKLKNNYVHFDLKPAFFLTKMKLYGNPLGLFVNT